MRYTSFCKKIMQFISHYIKIVFYYKITINYKFKITNYYHVFSNQNLSKHVLSICTIQLKQFVIN